MLKLPSRVLLLTHPRFAFVAALFATLVVGEGLTPAQSAEGDASGYRVEEAAGNQGWDIYEGKQLVAGYRFDSNGKPIVFPLLSPAGHRMTRDFPMLPAAPHEKQDHDHHRSLWLTHGEVNGIDFWLDDKERNCGTTVHRDGSAKVDKAGSVVITTDNDWLSPEGKRVLSDRRRLVFSTVDGRRVVDCDFRLIASDGEVHFGDTKEGTFGIRVAGTMKVDANLGGQITNAEGVTDKEAWGLRSPWVDYTGPVDDATAGITAHYHPSSHAFPCRWHVRTYGLFAANPFGEHHFFGGDQTGGYKLPDGQSLTMSLRLVIHDGEFDPARAAADFKAYAEAPRPAGF